VLELRVRVGEARNAPVNLRGSGELEILTISGDGTAHQKSAKPSEKAGLRRNEGFAATNKNPNGKTSRIAPISWSSTGLPKKD